MFYRVEVYEVFPAVIKWVVVDVVAYLPGRCGHYKPVKWDFFVSCGVCRPCNYVCTMSGAFKPE